MLLYALRKQLVAVTPPLKHFYEEKLLFALFHYPLLTDFWQQELGENHWNLLQRVLPKTWIIDPRPLPPHGIIPGLTAHGRPVQTWQQLRDLSKSQRELVLKVSGFSPQAWGSRGVRIGHDLSQTEWQDALSQSLSDFHQGTPHILQTFHKGARVSARYWHVEAANFQTMQGRVRLCPYYFVNGGAAKLGGALATICPLNKKLIHGMPEAIMVPVGV